MPEGVSDTSNVSGALRFGPFELNFRSGELHKHGIRIRLHQQPCRILQMLLKHPGEVVLREEIRQALWPDDTVVEFDPGINAAIQRLRDALGDSAESPQYIETLPRRGYRFLGTVEASPSTSADTAGAAPERSAIPPRAHRGALRAAVAVGFVVLAAMGVWASRSFRAAELPQFERLTFRPGIIQSARFAPGGKSVTYAASWDGEPVNLFSLQLGSPESRPLGFPFTGLLAIARTGELAVSKNVSLQWMRSRGTLAELPATGGAPHEVLDNVEFADWTPDGKQMTVAVAETTSGRLEFPRGHVVFQASGSGWPGDPKVSPSGKLVAFADHYYSGDDGSVAVVDLQGHKRTLTRVFDSLQGLAWSPNGKEIWFTASEGGASNRRLLAVTLGGEIRMVAQPPNNLKLQDIAANGQVLVTMEDSSARVHFIRSKDSVPRDLTWLTWAVKPILSADGRTLLMTENDEATGGKSVIYLRGTDGSAPVRLGENLAISLSPDEKWVASTGAPSGRPNIVLFPVKAGVPISIDTGALELTGDFIPGVPRVAWMPDSKSIVFAARQPGRAARTFVQAIQGGPPHPITPEGIWGTVLSRDGAQMIVFDSKSNAFLFRVKDGAMTALPSLSNAYEAIEFGSDRQSLYLVKKDRPKTIWRMDLATGRIRVWREIPVNDPAVIITNPKITPDGEAVAYTYLKAHSELYLANGLR